MSTDQTKAVTTQNDIRGTIQKMEPQFKMALPNHIPAEKFVRVLQTAVNNNPNLAKANRQSLLAACMRAAQDGLLPDGKEAALVTFKDSVSYMPMVAGILKKVRNSGELASLSPHVVYENDFFDYWVDEMGEHIKHKPKLEGKRGDFKLVYCIARMKDQSVYIEVMSKEEIDKVRAVSRSKDGGPWKEWYDQMAIKTVIRRLSKRLPSSTDLEMVIKADDEVFMPEETEAAAKEPQKKTKSGRLSRAMGISEQEERDVSDQATEAVEQEPVETKQESVETENELPI